MLSQFMLWLRTFVTQEEKGQTLIEYGLILVLIAIVVIVLLTAVGGSLNAIFLNISQVLGFAEPAG